MAKTKPAAKKKPTRGARAAKSTPRAKRARRATRAAKPTPRAQPAARKEEYTAEYLDYLERYTIGGASRPRLTPGEYDRLDEEMLDLLETQTERGLNDEQIIRLQELEYLLLDSE